MAQLPIKTERSKKPTSHRAAIILPMWLGKIFLISWLLEDFSKILNPFSIRGYLVDNLISEPNTLLDFRELWPRNMLVDDLAIFGIAQTRILINSTVFFVYFFLNPNFPFGYSSIFFPKEAKTSLDWRYSSNSISSIQLDLTFSSYPPGFH